MSLLDIFKLPPGEGMRFEVRALRLDPPHAASAAPERERLALEIRRPDEGASRELALTLQGADGRSLGRGRIPIDGGYLAVIREMRRQLAPLARSGAETDAKLEFDLVELPERAANRANRASRRLGAAELEGPGSSGEYGLP
jgi:hypothetical protein